MKLEPTLHGLHYEPVVVWDTTDVVAADQAGVRISAPDWGPSGSKNVLHELKVADLWNTNNLDAYFSDYDLAAMVTKNPALGNNWDDSVGTINAGLYAILLSLIRSTKTHIETLSKPLMRTFVDHRERTTCLWRC